MHCGSVMGFVELIHSGPHSDRFCTMSVGSSRHISGAELSQLPLI